MPPSEHETYMEISEKKLDGDCQSHLGSLYSLNLFKRNTSEFITEQTYPWIDDYLLIIDGILQFNFISLAQDINQ